jgi:hypothetical protein
MEHELTAHVDLLNDKGELNAKAGHAGWSLTTTANALPLAGCASRSGTTTVS